MKEKEKKEIEIEKKEWANCGVCEERYSDDIRINTSCLHSYCYQCIKDTSSTSKRCPICNEALPDDLSSLPHNYILEHWHALSPPSPPSSPSSYLFDDFQSEVKERKCEECNEKKSKVYCVECDQYYCMECSTRFHSYKKTSKHQIKDDFPHSPPPFNIFEYYHCDKHPNKKMELYCIKCDELLCHYCIDDYHFQHSTHTVEKYIAETKNKWKSNFESIHNHFYSLFQFDFIEKSLLDKLSLLTNEIQQLEELLRQKKDEAHNYMIELRDIREKKNMFDVNNRFVQFFINSLPLLPLSSFYPSKLSSNQSTFNNNNNKQNKFDDDDDDDDDDNNNKKNTPKIEEKSKRIKDFFLPINLNLVYSKYTDQWKNIKGKMIDNNAQWNSHVVFEFAIDHDVKSIAFCKSMDRIVISSSSQISPLYYRCAGDRVPNPPTLNSFNFILPNIYQHGRVCAITEGNAQIARIKIMISNSCKSAFGSCKEYKSSNSLGQSRAVSCSPNMDIAICFPSAIEIQIANSQMLAEQVKCFKLSFEPSSIAMTSTNSYSNQISPIIIADANNNKLHLYSWSHSQNGIHLNTIKEIDMCEYGRLSTSPQSIAIHENNHYFAVVDSGNSQILFFNFQGNFQFSFPSPPTPQCIAFDPNSDEFLISSATCIYILRIPQFKSKIDRTAPRRRIVVVGKCL